MVSNLTKRQIYSLLAILALLVAIPVVIFLVKQQQIFKSGAFSNPALIFVDNADVALPGDPPTTTTQNVRLKIDNTIAASSP